jgi:hypothetical protein
MADEATRIASANGQSDADARTMLREELLEAEMRLGRFYARDAIISLLNNWPTTSPLSVEVLGGPANFLKALRLIAKAYLAQPIPNLRQSGEISSAGGDIMHILWTQLQRLCRYSPKFYMAHVSELLIPCAVFVVMCCQDRGVKLPAPVTR